MRKGSSLEKRVLSVEQLYAPLTKLLVLEQLGRSIQLPE